MAALEIDPGEISARSGVDVLCFGGTKNGISTSEAVIFFDTRLAEDFAYRCKQSGQLASKMRYMAAPWASMLDSGAWLDNARQANRCARRLAAGIEAIEGLSLMYPCEANAVFVRVPEAAQVALRALGWRFYTFIGNGGVRFMCSWATTEAAVDALLADLRQVIADAGQ